MSAASIIVELLMKTGSFVTDNERAAKSMQKLKKEAYDTGRQIGDSLNGIGSAIGITLTIAGLTALVKSSIDAADHLNDLSKKTGIAVETLGGLGFAASNAGGDLDTMAAGAGKLNKQIAAAASGNKDAIDLFKTMGISIRDTSGQLKTADAVIIEMAGHFEGWEDGPEKAALALRAFGKAGEGMIPVLDDGAKSLRDSIAYYNKYSGVTAEVARKSDQFNDTLGKINLLTGSFGRTLASELLTPMQTLADRWLDAKEKGDGLKSTAESLVSVFKGVATVIAFVGSTVQIVGDRIGAFAAQLGVLLELGQQARQNKGMFDIFGSAALSVDDYKAAMAKVVAIQSAARDSTAETQKSFHALIDTMNGKGGAGPGGAAAFNDRRFEGERPQPKARAPLLPDSGAAGSAAAEAQKLYEGQVQAARAFGQQQKAVFDYANRTLDVVFEQGLTSLRSYYDQQGAVRDQALREELQAIDLEIAARRKESQDAKLNPAQQLDATNKLREAERKRSETTVEAARSASLARLEEQKTFEQYAERFISLQGAMADAAGDDRLSASLKISRQIADAQRTLAAVGADPGMADELRRQLEGRADLAESQKQYARLVERSGFEEDRVLRRAQEGGASELDTLRALGAERARSLTQLGLLVDQATELALQTGSPDAIANAERLTAAYEKAAAEVSPMLLKIRDDGAQVGETLASGLADAALEGDGFLDTLHNLDKALARIALNELFTKPFGDWVKNLVGGNGQQSGGGGWIGAVGDAIGSFFGGGMAGGGSTAPNTLYQVGEHGPELYDDGRHQLLLTGASRGRIDPNPRMQGGGRTQVVNQQFVLPNRIDKRTQAQVGADSARGLAVANLRNN